MFNVMRTFAAQTTGITTKDQINYMAAQRQAQNNLAKSGGAVTIPQFRQAGPAVGVNSNDNIGGMANHQLKMDAQSQYNSCVGQSAASCSGTLKGGRSRRRRYKRTRRYRSFKRS